MAGRILAVVVLALIATVLAGRVIRRAVARIPVVRDRARLDQRGRTLSAALKSTLVAAIWIIALMTVMSELGVKLGAFVATATIVGGALAFGAQTMVRDVIAGFFVLAEDQYGVGDVVDLGHATGTVENVTLRSTRLRDSEGRVWWVPNGQIVRVANLTQEFANAVLDVGFPLTADVTATTAVLLAVVEPYGGEVVGVQELADDRFVLRVVARTPPGEQFARRRALRAAIADAYRDERLPSVPAGSTTTIVVSTQPDAPLET